MSLPVEASILLAPGAEEAVLANLEVASKRPAFGNARYVRALWEDSFANMAMRAHEDGETLASELEVIEVGDIPTAMRGPGVGEKRRVGFLGGSD